MLWVGGNGLILWAQQYASSGFSCVMASTAPIWATVAKLLFYRKRPSLPLVVSLLIGFTGVVVLSASSPGLKGTTAAWAVSALVLGPLCWALGSVFQARRPVNLAPLVVSGYQHLAASFGFLVVVLAIGEPMPHPVLSAWIAWGYLVIFGSVIAFTSYVCVLRLLPISIAMTYAYVNPVLALFLGWLLLREPIAMRTLLGAGLVILGVFAIFSIKQGKGRWGLAFAAEPSPSIIGAPVAPDPLRRCPASISPQSPPSKTLFARHSLPISHAGSPRAARDER